jgi:hypothetical protein
MILEAVNLLQDMWEFRDLTTFDRGIKNCDQSSSATFLQALRSFQFCLFAYEKVSDGY